ncbi:MAG TPA: 1-deoxy-D-xylulose-5-phosphate reductoisomerase, partial [Elusimicrobia bacterium]|nr:1-deoxy-D-xylulose-5-phosphate reductoisomerase [Elusimicrobiota bacterium]
MHRSGAYLDKNYRILGLSADKNIDLLEEQIREFHPRVVAVMDETAADKLRAKSEELRVKVLSGIEGLKELASLPETNFVVFAVVGAVGLLPFLEAVRAGKTVALANKETLVIAGEIILSEVRKYGAKILPLDSEHSA